MWPSNKGLWQEVTLEDEAVADTPDRDDLVAKGAEFLAQPGDMRVHRSLEAVVLVAPDSLDQKLAAKRATGMLDEELQQLEFLRGKVKLRAIQRRHMHGRIDMEWATHNGGRCPISIC